MKYCNQCGVHLKDSDMYCNICGGKCSSFNSNNLNELLEVADKNNVAAIIGFIFSLLSIFGFSLPGAILSAYGIANAKSCNGNGKGLAVAGLVISIISLLITMVVIYVYGYAIGFDDGFEEAELEYFDWY